MVLHIQPYKIAAMCFSVIWHNRLYDLVRPWPVRVRAKIRAALGAFLGSYWDHYLCIHVLELCKRFSWSSTPQLLPEDAFYLRRPQRTCCNFCVGANRVVGALNYGECQQELSGLLKSIGQPLPSAEWLWFLRIQSWDNGLQSAGPFHRATQGSTLPVDNYFSPHALLYQMRCPQPHLQGHSLVDAAWESCTRGPAHSEPSQHPVSSRLETSWALRPLLQLLQHFSVKLPNPFSRTSWLPPHPVAVHPSVCVVWKSCFCLKSKRPNLVIWQVVGDVLQFLGFLPICWSIFLSCGVEMWPL